MKRFLAVALASFALVAQSEAMAAAGASIKPVTLTCEYAANPLLDIQNPHLAWVNQNPAMTQGAAQTAYRVRVATSADGFNKPYWDSGKVSSSESAFIKYAGPKLKSRTTYWWQVMVWDE
ncbi:MAG: hypothetical protein IKC78_00595, partial [Alistipes sp.]|nr:hypothetical protein [Alistipes sp.]